MVLGVCLEEMEGRWVAHVPTLLGCFSSGETQEQALERLPRAVERYRDWCRSHGDTTMPAGEGAIQVEVEEMIREWPNPARPRYTVNPFFAADAPPLTGEEIALATRRLLWSRAELLASIEGLLPEEMDRALEGEWSIRDILHHTGRAELWYLDRLNLAPPREQDGGWRWQLEAGRACLLQTLPKLEGVARFELRAGELWSPRKMVRRALWHERDHTQHILQFRVRLGR